LRSAFDNSKLRPHVVAFTSSSTARNFVALLGHSGRPPHNDLLAEVKLASIGPVTSSTLRDLGLPVAVEAKKYTIPGLIQAICDTTRG
jgi:uroporphyrinogen III methyltransferase / synthase